MAANSLNTIRRDRFGFFGNILPLSCVSDVSEFCAPADLSPVIDVVSSLIAVIRRLRVDAGGDDDFFFFLLVIFFYVTRFFCIAFVKHCFVSVLCGRALSVNDFLMIVNTADDIVQCSLSLHSERVKI